MRFTIISHIRYSKEITRASALYEIGYRNALYNELERELKKQSAFDLEIVIVYGDFFWDYRYFRFALIFILSFYKPSYEIKGFFWKHYHNIKNEFIKKINQYVPYDYSMPEKIGWTIHKEEA
ncbi:MAG: hypothetical protein ACTSR8_11885 [Promethearchaeota archaeon]